MNEKELSKKAREKRDVAGILSLLGIADEQTDWSGECPDCIYHDPDGKIIGIEVVRCSNKGDDARQMLSLLDKACDVCTERLEENGWKDKFITVSFFDKWLWHRPIMRAEEFYSAITEEVLRHLEYYDYIYAIKYLTDIDGYNRLEKQGAFDFKFIESINVYETPNFFCVASVISHFVSDVLPETVEKCIKEKNSKLQGYRQMTKNNVLKEYWLFIALDWGANSALNVPSGAFSNVPS